MKIYHAVALDPIRFDDMVHLSMNTSRKQARIIGERHLQTYIKHMRKDKRLARRLAVLKDTFEVVSYEL